MEDAFKWLQKGLSHLNYPMDSVFSNPNITIENIQHKDLFIQSLHLKSVVLMEYYKKSGDIQKLNLSFEVLQTSLQLVDELVKSAASDVSLAGLKNRFYGIYVDAIATAYQLYKLTKKTMFLEKAFQFSEQSKVFALRQSIARKIKQLQAKSHIQDLLEKDENFRKSIDRYEQKYFDTELSLTAQKAYLDSLLQQKQAYNAFIQQLKNSSDQNAQTFYNERFNNQVSSIQQIQQSILDEKTAVIEYHLGENLALAFVITSSDFFAIPLNPIAQLWGKPLNIFKDALTTELTAQEFGKSAYLFYEVLLANVIKQLKEQSIKKLIIVPDHQLRNITFEALLQSSPKNQAFQDFDFIFKDFEISYLYSLTTQNLLNQLKSKTNKASLSFAAFVGKYGTDTMLLADAALADLRCSNRPIRAITEATIQDILPLFPKSQLFYPAYETAFKDSAQYFKILHLAMHGCMEESQNPLTYNLLFTENPYSKNDATLSVGEILYEISLQADLVVLASCNTEKGTQARNDRIATIARAFRNSGVNNIVATLNSVNDQTTAVILTYFYQNLQKGDNKSKALQQAKLKYLNEAKDRLNPKFWANLILIGEG